MAALTAPGTPLSELKGVGPKTIERIETHGVHHDRKLADMTPEQLNGNPGIGEKMVEKFSCRWPLISSRLRIPRRKRNLSRVSRSKSPRERP